MKTGLLLAGAVFGWVNGFLAETDVGVVFWFAAGFGSLIGACASLVAEFHKWAGD